MELSVSTRQLRFPVDDVTQWACQKRILFKPCFTRWLQTAWSSTSVSKNQINGPQGRNRNKSKRNVQTSSFIDVWIWVRGIKLVGMRERGGSGVAGGGWRSKESHCNGLATTTKYNAFKMEIVIVSNLCMLGWSKHEIFLLGLTLFLVLVYTYSHRCLWCGWTISCFSLFTVKA